MSDFVITHISIPRPHTDIIKQVYITEVQEALLRADGSKVNNVATEMRYVTDFYYGCKKLHCICKSCWSTLHRQNYPNYCYS